MLQTEDLCRTIRLVQVDISSKAEFMSNPFRINTYKNIGGWVLLLLTGHFSDPPLSVTIARL
jgi:hypothetical protein